MTTTTTTIIHESSGIVASRSAWRALGFDVYSDDTLNSGPHGVEALLFFGVQATGRRDESAVIAAIVERDRRNEERTRVTAESRLADAIREMAASVGAETAREFVARLPDRIRPYAEKFLTNRG